MYCARIGADFRWIGGRTAFAADLRQEGIYSTNLGRPLDSLAYKPAIPHAYVETVSQPLLPSRQQQVYPRHDERTNLALSLEHNLLLGRFTASLGILANSNSYLGDGLHFYPGIDLAYRIGSGWKAYLSYNKGFRLPTFTDLYYKSPTIEGNRDLKAEESHSLQAGVKVNCQLSARQRSTVNSSARPNGTLDPSRTVNCQLSLRAFYNRGRRMIDWVMYNETDVFHSANFDLDNIGVSVDARFDFQPSSVPSQLSPFLRSITIGYAFIHQHRRDAAYVYKSNYAMEYLRHKFTATLHHNIWRHLTANWQLRVQDREGAYIKYENATSTGQLVRYRPYALLDLKLQWDAPRYLLWVEGTNLTNHTYYDLGNIPQPGLTILAGARLRF